jgi:hypothetical protein
MTVVTTKSSRWLTAWGVWSILLLNVASLTTGVLGLFYYWFAIANRYVIFLYYHLGAGPFDKFTISRYWMAGLVASGVVLVGHTFSHWFIARLHGVFYRPYTPPPAGLVWGLSAGPVGAGIIFITTTFNNPTLPLALAVQCAGVTLLGLALALWPARLVARQTSELVWLGAYGVGLAPLVLILRFVELPAQGLVAPAQAYGTAAISLVGSLLWLAGAQTSRVYARRPLFPAWQLGWAGLSVSYLLLPLAHYLWLTPPGLHYISTSSNFFATQVGVQAICLSFSAVLTIALSRWPAPRPEKRTRRKTRHSGEIT